MSDLHINAEKHLDVVEAAVPFTCKYCGLPSWIESSDQLPPPDYCHETDHGTAENL
jgi:hypothetical protein